MNIINVQERHNILSFSGDVMNIVANSTNFYLQFDLDEEWNENAIVTAVFNFDGVLEHVELDEERKCKIPPTTSSKILFCITTAPSEEEKLSSTILSLDVEPSGETFLDGIPVYENAHRELLGLIEDLKQGRVNAQHSVTSDSATNAGYAVTAGSSETEVSLTGNQQINGEKDFLGTIKQGGVIVPNVNQVVNNNFIINGNFKINQRDSSKYTRSGTDICTADRWVLRDHDGLFNTSTKTLTGMDENGPTMLCQWIEDYAPFASQTITVSATINGTRYSDQIELPNVISLDEIINIYQCDEFTFRVFLKRSYKKVGVQFLVSNGNSIVIADVKVEVGNIATKYIGRPLPEEYLLCQRYYQRIRIYMPAFATSATTLMMMLPVPTSFKQVKTISMVSYPTIIDENTSQVADNMAVSQVTDAGIVLSMTGTNLTPNKIYFLTGGLIKLDGEYY